MYTWSEILELAFNNLTRMAILGDGTKLANANTHYENIKQMMESGEPCPYRKS